MLKNDRCIATLKGNVADRCPRYLPGIACEVSSRILGRPVYTGTGSLHYAETCALIKGEAAHAEFVEALLLDLVAIHRALDIDVFRMPWRQTSKPFNQLDSCTFLFGDPDTDYSICKYVPDSGDFGPVKTVRKTGDQDYISWLKNDIAMQQSLASDESVVALDPDYLTICQEYGDEFFVVCNSHNITIGYDEDMMMALITHPDLVREKLEVQADKEIALAKALLKTSYPRVLIGGGDLAGNEGPFFSPACFQQVYLPVLQRLFSEMNKLGIHYVFRTDGNLWPIADMLFKDTLCQGFGEVDRDATMTITALHQRYPDLVLWNNMSCSALRTQNREWVKQESEKCLMESCGRNYFHGSSNAIVNGTPVENIQAMFFL